MASKRRALVAGWFSYEQSDFTAGDLLACDLVCEWLGEAGFEVDVAKVAPLDGGIPLEAADPADYTHAVFVCGPFMQNHWEADFLRRFSSCFIVGVNLTLPVPLDDWNPFDRLYERDSSARVQPDITLLSRQPLVPVVGLCLVEPYAPARVDLADAALARLLGSLEVAVVPIDTRLDVNATGLRTKAEVESLLARMDVVVTTRLHGTVLALKNGVPALALDPEPGGAKILQQGRALGWPATFEIGSVTDDTLRQAFDYCLTTEARGKAAACRDQAVATLEKMHRRFVADLAGAPAPPPAVPARAAGPPPRRHIVHAIHDFLPRHVAGSEIYAFDLGRALAETHDVTIVCAEYAPGLPHGHVTWRVHDGLPVVEITNNWVCATFEDTYRPPLITERLDQVLEALAPDVLHVHSLLNLSFDLPALAKARGIPVVATLHDYTLVCPSGGQRLHRAEAYMCHDIDPARCARCFADTAFYRQMAFGAMAPRPGLVQRVGHIARRHAPRLAHAVAGAVSRAAALAVTPGDLQRRLDDARRVLREMDLVVSPSMSLANHYRSLGADPERVRVSDYGFPPLAATDRLPGSGPLRIGYVGTIVWHKGVHVAIEALRHLPAGACELQVFGDLDVAPDYAADLQKRAEGLPVRFLGSVDRAGAALAYAGIDVLVVPSIWLENSPLVIHEAFMAGVPVIAARIGGIPGLVRDGWNGWLVDPGSAEALAACLRDLLAHRHRLAVVATRLPRVKTITEDADAWVRRYEEVLAGRAEASS